MMVVKRDVEERYEMTVGGYWTQEAHIVHFGLAHVANIRNFLSYTLSIFPLQDIVYVIKSHNMTPEVHGAQFFALHAQV